MHVINSWFPYYNLYETRYATMPQRCILLDSVLSITVHNLFSNGFVYPHLRKAKVGTHLYLLMLSAPRVWQVKVKNEYINTSPTVLTDLISEEALLSAEAQAASCLSYQVRTKRTPVLKQGVYLSPTNVMKIHIHTVTMQTSTIYRHQDAVQAKQQCVNMLCVISLPQLSLEYSSPPKQSLHQINSTSRG